MRQKVKYPNLPEDFREMAKFARVKKGITLTVMAKDFGVYPATISQYERGDRNYSYEWAVRVRDYLEMDYDLPEPEALEAGVLTRKRNSAPPSEKEPFYICVDGELIEVLTYRKWGPVVSARVIKDVL